MPTSVKPQAVYRVYIEGLKSPTHVFGTGGARHALDVWNLAPDVRRITYALDGGQEYDCTPSRGEVMT